MLKEPLLDKDAQWRKRFSAPVVLYTQLAKGARVACALGAAFFASLSIVLGFRWRRSLARILRHTDT